MDGVELKTFLASMILATVIYFGLNHYQTAGIKSSWGKGLALVIVGAYICISIYYLTEVAGSAKTIMEA